MPSFLFRSRWIAVVWVAGVLAAVSYFFGGGGRDALDGLASGIRARKQAVETRVESPPIVIPDTRPRRVEIRHIEVGPDGEPLADPEERGIGTADAEAPGSPPERDEQGDSYIVVDGSVEVENAAEEDLRFDREDQSSSSPSGPSMPSSSSSLRSPS